MAIGEGPRSSGCRMNQWDGIGKPRTFSSVNILLGIPLYVGVAGQLLR